MKSGTNFSQGRESVDVNSLHILPKGTIGQNKECTHLSIAFSEAVFHDLLRSVKHLVVSVTSKN